MLRVSRSTATCWLGAQPRLAPLVRGRCRNVQRCGLPISSPAIKDLQEAGATTLRAIADGLTAQSIPTARGSGEWSPTQVKRVLEHLNHPKLPTSPRYHDHVVHRGAHAPQEHGTNVLCPQCLCCY